jgi:hypothetical protein
VVSRETPNFSQPIFLHQFNLISTNQKLKSGKKVAKKAYSRKKPKAL